MKYQHNTGQHVLEYDDEDGTLCIQPTTGTYDDIVKTNILEPDEVSELLVWLYDNHREKILHKTDTH